MPYLIIIRETTAAPEWLSARRCTYKQTLQELDTVKPVSKGSGKIIKLPTNLPFSHLNIRQQRKLIMSLGRLEVMKSRQNKTERATTQLKMIHEGNFIRIVPVTIKKKLRNKSSKVQKANLASEDGTTSQVKEDILLESNSSNNITKPPTKSKKKCIPKGRSKRNSSIKATRYLPIPHQNLSIPLSISSLTSSYTISFTIIHFHYHVKNYSC